MNYFLDSRECSKYLKSERLHRLLTSNTTEPEATDTLMKLFDLLGHPYPAKDILSAFKDSSVVKLLAMSLWQRIPYDPMSTEDRNSIMDCFQPLKDGDRIVKARILGPLGSYPNIGMDFGSARYIPYHGIPLMVSFVHYDMEQYTEVGYLNEQELIASSSIMLAHKSPLFHFHFESGNDVTLSKFSANLPSVEQFDSFIYELLSLKLNSPAPKTLFQPVTSALSPAMYSFSPFHFRKEAAALFAACDTSDQLLLRTLFYLHKSRMLWSNRVFGEDAVANVFFSLEGCLLLLQRKYKGSDSKIDLSLLKELFQDNFKRGEELLDFIKEAYRKRIDIVHPSPKADPNWQPSIIADDFYEYYEIVWVLMNRILIDRNIQVE